MQKYRAAVIGCSRIGGFIDNEIAPSGQISYPLPWSHAACYEACDRTDLVACADLREDVDEYGTELSEFVPFPDFERRSLSLTLLEDLVHSLDTGNAPKGGVRLARDITEMILAFIVSHQRGGARVELPLVDVNLRHRRLKPPKQPRYETRYPRLPTSK